MKPKILLISPYSDIAEPFRIAMEGSGISATVTDSSSMQQQIPPDEHFVLAVAFWSKSRINADNLTADSPVVDALFLLGNQASSGTIRTFRNGVYRMSADQPDTDKFVKTVKELLEEDFSYQQSSAQKASAQNHDWSTLNSAAFDNLIGESPQMKQVRRLIRQFSRYPSLGPVLITGETGTGKELVAKLLHYSSPRAGQPFIPLNCSAIPETLFESQLFGHRKGAFTGAHDNKKGFIDAAQDGTLFLDEISSLKLELQPKLLRLLENGSYLPVGEAIERRSNAQIFAASNQDLEELVEKNQFREDLFYRLKGFNIQLPPLRERPKDILPLANHFLSPFSEKFDAEPETILSEIEEILIKYHWPGNVRELKHAILEAMVKAEGRPIRLQHLFPAITKNLMPPASKGIATLDEVERMHILSVISRNRGKIRKSVRDLGIMPQTLRAKLKQYGFPSEKLDEWVG